MQVAVSNRSEKIVKKIQQEKNISREEAEREFLEGDFFVAITMREIAEKTGRVGMSLKSIVNSILRVYKTKKLEKAEDELIKNIDNEKVTPQSLLNAIENKMKLTQELRVIEKENDELENKLSPEIKDKRKEFFKKLTDDFITTGKTMSEIYEELMEDPDFDPEDFEYDKFEFEDVMDGIMDSLNGNVESLLGEERFKDLKENELIYRQFDILEKNFNVAMEDLDEKSDEFFNSYAKEKINRRKVTDKARLYFAGKRGFGVNSLAININYETKMLKPKKPAITSKMAIEERNKVSNDRNQIIKLSREQEISPSEASKIYFTQNPEALNSYSKKERKILLGETKNHSAILDSSKFLSFLKKIVLRYNDRALKYVALEIDRNQKILNEYENDPHHPKVYADAVKLAEKLNIRMKKLEESSRKLSDDKKTRTASDVIIEKEEKANKKVILSEYVKSGKSAIEIYRDIEANGNKFGYTFENVLDFIEEESKSYMTKSERKGFRKTEESIQQISIKLESFKSKKEQADNNETLKDWSTFYEKEIAKLEGEIAQERANSETYKNKIARRIGIKRETNTQTLNDEFQQEDGKVEQNNAPLVAENIQMQEGIIPNVKKIAQKSRVTTSKVRDAFAKIKSFWKDRKVLKSAENVQNQQTDLQSTQYEDDEITQ